MQHLKVLPYFQCHKQQVTTNSYLKNIYNQLTMALHELGILVWVLRNGK